MLERLEKECILEMEILHEKQFMELMFAMQLM